jgi:DNA-binding NtrC family response regulator
MGVTTPILVITGNEALAIAEKALQAGAYGYIPKPFTLAYIDHLIATALMAGRAPSTS